MLHFFNFPFTTRAHKIYHYVTLIMLFFALLVVALIILIGMYISVGLLIFIFEDQLEEWNNIVNSFLLFSYCNSRKRKQYPVRTRPGAPGARDDF
jgi:hypothetical protein